MSILRHCFFSNEDWRALCLNRERSRQLRRRPNRKIGPWQQTLDFSEMVAQRSVQEPATEQVIFYARWLFSKSVGWEWPSWK